MTAEKHQHFLLLFFLYILFQRFSSSFLLVTVQALRDSPAYDSFLRRWKLSVYFSLRFQVQPSAILSCSGMIFKITLHPLPHFGIPLIANKNQNNKKGAILLTCSTL